MGKSEERQGNPWTYQLTGLLMGALLALAVIIVGLLLGSVAIARGMIGEGSLCQVTWVSCVVGCFIGGKWGVRRWNGRRLLVGLMVGGLSFLYLALLGLLLWGTIDMGQGGLGTLCATLCGGGIAGLLTRGVKRKKRKKKQKHKG